MIYSKSTANLIKCTETQFVIYDYICSARCQDTTDVELIPEREDTQPDSPLEDAVSFTLKRESSIRRSQRNGRLAQ